MKESARYAKIVEWSEEDQCYVGSSGRDFANKMQSVA